MTGHGMSHADLAAYVTESRRAQGLPDRITDPSAIHHAAALIKASRDRRMKSEKQDAAVGASPLPAAS